MAGKTKQRGTKEASAMTFNNVVHFPIEVKCH